MRRRIAGFVFGCGVDATLVAFLLALEADRFWFVFFLFTSLLGVLYPVLGFLLADLRSVVAKAAVVAVLLVHVFAVSAFFFAESILWVSKGFSLWESGFSGIILLAFAIVPPLICAMYFVHYTAKNGVVSELHDRAELNIHGH